MASRNQPRMRGESAATSGSEPSAAEALIAKLLGLAQAAEDESDVHSERSFALGFLRGEAFAYRKAAVLLSRLP